jgi:hypothetical protein
MFLLRTRRSKDQMSAEASLAEAEAARRQEERKHADEQPVRERLARIEEENDVARLLRAALNGDQ